MIGVAREACKKHHDGELKYYKSIAIYVKEQLDKKLGGSYHICVGKLQLFISGIHFFYRFVLCFVPVCRHKLRKLLHISDSNNVSVLDGTYRFPSMEAWVNHLKIHIRSSTAVSNVGQEINKQINSKK